MAPAKTLFSSLPLLVVMAQACWSVCVEVASEDRAVMDSNTTLTCISCMRREEVKSETYVKWFYNADNNDSTLIFVYDGTPQEQKSHLSGRLQWKGSKDLQEVSLGINNLKLNDTGTYTCQVTRHLNFDVHQHSITTTLKVHLVVTENVEEDFTAVVSEIMMYILLVFLTIWLLIEMVYCYKKISKADDMAQDTAKDYLAIPSENKETPAVPVGE
ncbi:sodium channel subunit beta-3 isoform X1 [Polypterus senegalus]|nr:sodium channel subunit beta-3 isoform X1 [Polypterus senegalus]